MKQKHYDNELVDRISSKIPDSIIRALSLEGWNFLGIYELVKKEIIQYQKEQYVENKPGCTCGCPGIRKSQPISNYRIIKEPDV